MFRKLRVNQDQNWWQTGKGWEYLIFRQVAASLRNKEVGFFAEHPLETMFSWKAFDTWLLNHDVRLNGPSQFMGLAHFESLTDEAKDAVHFRVTRQCASAALQMWSHFRGDGRMIGRIENNTWGSFLDSSHEARWQRSDIVISEGTKDTREDWKYGNSELSELPLTEYFVTKRKDVGVFWQETLYTRQSGENTLIPQGANSHEKLWPMVQLALRFPRNATQYSKFYD